MLSVDQCRQLEEDGYLILPGFIGEALLAELRQRTAELFAAEGDAAGSEFKQEPGARRLANLIDKGEVFRRCMLMPVLLEAIAAILGPRFKLSSLNMRSAEPFSNSPQPLHADAGAIADEHGYWVANSVWLLDDFTPDNGPLRLVPGSHRWRKLPQDVVADPYAPHPSERIILGKAGDLVVMNAHAWHGGTGNRTAAPRCAMHGFFTRWDKPQQQYQKRLLRPETQRELSPALRELLALDDPLNDALCAAGSGRSGFLK